jgi:hypothetical protein
VAGPASGRGLPSKTQPTSPPTKQLWSVGGAGTESSFPQNWGRYQQRLDIIKNWHRVGVVVQGTAIDGGKYSPGVYLEVESWLDDTGDPVQPWPNRYVVPRSDPRTRINRYRFLGSPPTFGYCSGHTVYKRGTKAQALARGCERPVRQAEPHRVGTTGRGCQRSVEIS